jgi:hypothetical protein
LKASLSRRVKRHFMLDLYRLIVPGGSAPKGAEGISPIGPSSDASGRKPAVASRYLEALSALEPSARSILSFEGGLEGISGDATGARLGWRASESYEARVTVPETLTLKAVASLTQAQDAATGTLSLGFLISLGAAISF